MKFNFKPIVAVALLPLVLAAQSASGSSPDRSPSVFLANPGNLLGRLSRPYRPREVSPTSDQNSERIQDLIRAGQLYLSLSDAIALALENNLDIQLERYLLPMANSDVLRAQGGGLLRGLSLLTIQPPPGIGGPNGPLLTNLTSGSTPAPLVNSNLTDLALISQQQNNLGITGATPLSNGAPIPLFDPFLSGQLNWTHTSTSQPNPLIAGGSNWLVSNTTGGNVGYTQGFSPGTQLNANFNSSRYTTNSTRYTYDPNVTGSLGFTITQPLLRGFGASVNRRFIRIAKNSEKVASLVFRQQVIDTVAGVSRLYTDLVSLSENVKVKQEALRLSERLYEDNKNKVDEGTLAPIEVTRAQAQVAASRQDLISAEGLARQQELIVKTMLTRGGLADNAIRNARIVPTDSVDVPQQEKDQPYEELVTTALGNRPDLGQSTIQIDNSRISLQGSRNGLKPELDLVGIAQNNGLSGNINTLALPAAGPLPPPGGFGTVLDQIARRNYPTYGVGIQLTLPLRNRVAQADVVRDELQLRQSEVRRKQLENQVRLEVADAQVALQQAFAAYEASVQTRVLQEQSVKVEQQKFDVGLSTNYMVIQYQSFLAQARSTEVAAKGAYAKARIALERATGSTLDVNQVSIDEAIRGHVSRPPAALPEP